MASKVVLEVLLDVPEVVRVVLVVVLMSRCPFKRLQSAGQVVISVLVLSFYYVFALRLDRQVE